MTERQVASERLRLENPLITCACGCNTVFPKFDIRWRPRRFLYGHARRLPPPISNISVALNPSRKVTPDVKREIQRLHEQGYGYMNIQKCLGLSIPTIRYHLLPKVRENSLLKKKEQGKGRWSKMTPEAKARHLIIVQRWRQKSDFKERRRNHRRLHEIGTYINGKHITIRGLNKRPMPSQCEVCNKQARLGYHHWGKNPNIGIWVCAGCHLAAQRIDQGLHQKYLFVKHQIETMMK